MLIELNDMREAQRSYEANMSAIQAVKSMALKELEIGKDLAIQEEMTTEIRKAAKGKAW